MKKPEDLDPKLTLRGGNSGLLINGQIYGSSESCLRKILLRAHGIEKAPDELSKYIFEIGHLNEKFFCKGLAAAGKEFIEEKPVVVPITDRVNFCGHSDVVLDSETLVYELKSVTSKHTYDKIFKKRDIRAKTQYLAQCLSYMLAFEYSLGKIAFTSYKSQNYTSKTKTHCIPYYAEVIVDIQDYLEEPSTANLNYEKTEFDLEILPSGIVAIDGEETQLHVQAVWDFQEAAAKVLEDVSIYPTRPVQASPSHWGECGFCPFKNICDRWEAKEIKTAQDFLEESRREVQSQHPTKE